MLESDSSTALLSRTDLIRNQSSYLHKKTNFENLKAQVEKLTLVKQRVLHKIEVARRNGEEIDNDVLEWLFNVDELIEEAVMIFRDERKGKKRCFGGLCPNLGTRRQLSKKAANEVTAMVLLLSQGEKFHEISSSTIPEDISSLVTSSQNPFISLWNYKRYYEKLVTEVEKLMDDRERVQRLMEVSRRNGESIYEDVSKWMMSVGALVDDTRSTFEAFEQKENGRCFIGLYPDLKARYNLGNKAVRQLKAVAELRGEVFDRVSYTTIPPNVWLTSTKVYENFGSRLSTLQGLYNTLQDRNINIVGVYGMGGIGKTVLVKQLAARAEAEKLFDVVIFAEVTSRPNIKKIQGDIADHLGLMFRQEDEEGRATRLFDRLKKEKNVLVILDDIWTSFNLRRVGVLVGDDHERYKVLLTSRDGTVLSQIGSQRNFFVDVLDEEENFDLFKKIEGDSAENLELQPLAFNIAKTCGGWPLAIASIALALRGKGISTWQNALRNLRRPSPNNFTGMLADVYSSIKLSYEDLKSLELKLTFLLCSIMKCAGDISVMQIFKYGIGLGLFEDVSLDEARNKVYFLVCQLKSSYLLLDSDSSERLTIHDIVGTSIASRDQHALILTNEITDMVSKDALRICTAISIHFSDMRELPDSLECPQLKFFNLLSDNPFIKIPNNFFRGMAKLGVLKLTKMHIMSLPSSLGVLVKLRTLCLDECILGNITGIGDLKNLEILSLSSSDIKLLPKEIGRLTRLRMLHLSNCSKLKVISPNVLSNLTCLEELYMGNSFVQWEVEGVNPEGRNASLDELNHLSRLTSLELHVKDAKILRKDLFSKLRRYRICIGDEWDWFGEDGTSKALKLKLSNSIFLEDGIISQLNGIGELYLDELLGSKNVLYDFDLDSFSQLEHLHIQNNSSFQCFVNSMCRGTCEAFPLLKSLSIHNLRNLGRIFVGQFTVGSFHNLKIIKVKKCDNLRNIFSYSIASLLPQLQTLEVIECKNVEVIFIVYDKIELGQIRSLTLKSLPQLRRLSEKVGSRKIIFEDELFDESVTFPMLEVLELAEINIQKIWPNQLPSNMFSSFLNLKHLIVQGCDKLKYIFSSLIFRRFANLQHLEICHCEVLEEVICMKELRGEEWNAIKFFQRLERLVLKDLKKFTRFCSGKYIEFPSLKQLEIGQCPQFKGFVFTNKSIDSEQVQPFFNEKVALPGLEELVISGMDNLEVISKYQPFAQPFPKLKLMEIRNCDKLLAVFPFNFPERFLQLESLTVTACGSLVEIFNIQRLHIEKRHSKAQLKELHIDGLPKLTNVWNKDPQVMLSFPKLRIVRVSRCQNLENLFPASIARNLFELEELGMIDCGVEEIVSKEERVEGIIRFVFPRLTFLNFSSLQQLRCFYPGAHTSEWKALRKLEVYDCDNVQIFISKFLDDQETNEHQLDVPAILPLFLVEKVFPNLEELKLGGKVVAVMWQGTFPELLFRRLAVLHIAKDESDVVPFNSFQRFHNLKKLILSHGSCKEIFLHEKVEGHVRMLTQIKELKLVELTNLKYLWKQESQLGRIFQDLEILDVWWCSNLINLVPSYTSFHYLTVLEVWFCQRLINLVAVSTAKTLVQLKQMKIGGCKAMTEVVASEGDVIEAEINFCKLKSLLLFGLESLTSFCSGSYAFKFPSLEELFVIECPNINIFSGGVLSTPNLQEVQLSWAVDLWRWDGDLNTTIRQLHKKVSSSYMKKKRGGRKAKLKTQAEELADRNGKNTTGKATVGTESCNSKTGGSNVVDNFGEQSGGAPDDSISGAAKAAGRQQKYGDLLGKKGTLKILEAELAHEDWWIYSEELNDKGLEGEEGKIIKEGRKE